LCNRADRATTICAVIAATTLVTLRILENVLLDFTTIDATRAVGESDVAECAQDTVTKTHLGSGHTGETPRAKVSTKTDSAIVEATT